MIHSAARIKRLREAFGIGLYEAKLIADGAKLIMDYVHELEAHARNLTNNQARKRAEQLTVRMDRLHHKLEMVRETYRITRNRIIEG